MPFAPDKGVALRRLEPSLSWMLHGRSASICRNTRTHQLVSDAVRDVLVAADLYGAVQFRSQGADLFRLRADLSCPHRTDAEQTVGPRLGAVFSLGEIHGADVLDDPTVCADAFDVLGMIKAYDGASSPLAIVSTYARWRVFWLDGSHDRSDAREPRSVANTEDVPAVRSMAVAGHILCASRSYERGDRQSVAVIGTALDRMHAQLTTSTTDPAVPRLLAHVGTAMAHVRWVRCVVGAPTAHPIKVADGSLGATDYVLTDDLGAGADGRAWKARPLIAAPSTENAPDASATDADAHPCDRVGSTEVVIKFGHQVDDARAGDEGDIQSGGPLWREALVWRRAWGVSGVRATILCGRPALIMPYARPVAADADEAIRIGAVASVLEAIERMAAAGICHDDMHWRHVGKIPSRLCGDQDVVAGDDPEETVVFFDLARVSRVRPERASARMKRALGLGPPGDGDISDADDDDDDSNGQSTGDNDGGSGDGSQGADP